MYVRVYERVNASVLQLETVTVALGHSHLGGIRTQDHQSIDDPTHEGVVRDDGGEVA